MKLAAADMAEASVRIEPASKRVLVVAYYFPPYGGGSVTRIHNFVKYLPQHGIVPLVYSVQEQYYEECYRDPDLLKEYADAVRIVRSRQYLGNMVKKARAAAMTSEAQPRRSRASAKRLLKKLAIPDEHVGWVLASVRDAIKLVRRESIDVILATGPPFSAHLLGALVARSTRTPLVLDYRDLWVGNVFYSQSRLVSGVQRALQNFTLQTARRVLVTNPAAASSLRQVFAVHAQVTVVENGFDLEEVRQAMASSGTGAHSDGSLTIAYVGSLTSRRTPEFFFAALRSFLNAHTGMRVKVIFAGYVAPQFKSLRSNMGLADCVEFYGELPRKQALQLMCGADVLLVLQRKSEGGDTAIPGKIYEYLATGKPVLVLDEGQGPTSQFLLDLGLDCVAEYDDNVGITRLLERVLLTNGEVARQFAALRPVIARYDRKIQTEAVANLLGQCDRT